MFNAPYGYALSPACKESTPIETEDDKNFPRFEAPSTLASPLVSLKYKLIIKLNYVLNYRKSKSRFWREVIPAIVYPNLAYP
jgi:hypothetical protein